MNGISAHTCVVAVAAVAVLAGCSAPNPPRTESRTTTVGLPSAAKSLTSTASGELDAAFQVRANAACKPFADWNDDHPFNFPGFNPAHPDVKTLPQVGAFFDRAPANHSFTTALRALRDPATGTVAWHAWLAQLDQALRLDRAQIAAAKSADAAAFSANVKQVLAHQPALDTALRALGFAPGDPCARVF